MIITMLIKRGKSSLSTLWDLNGSSFEKNVSPLHLRMHCDVWLKLTQWFWRRRFLNIVNVFSPFRNYLPLEKIGPLIWTKLISPLPKDALCQDCLILSQWILRRRFLNFFNVLLQFRNYFPLENGRTLYLNKLFLHPRIICDKFGWTCPSGSWEEDF